MNITHGDGHQHGRGLRGDPGVDRGQGAESRDPDPTIQALRDRAEAAEQQVTTLRSMEEMRRRSNESVMDAFRKIAAAIGDDPPTDLGYGHFAVGLITRIVADRDHAREEREKAQQRHADASANSQTLYELCGTLRADLLSAREELKEARRLHVEASVNGQELYSLAGRYKSEFERSAEELAKVCEELATLKAELADLLEVTMTKQVYDLQKQVRDARAAMVEFGYRPYESIAYALRDQDACETETGRQLDHAHAEIVELKQTNSRLQPYVQQSQALVARWRAAAAQIDSYHATMGSGYKACANELETVGGLIPVEQHSEKKDEKDLARGRTLP